MRLFLVFAFAFVALIAGVEAGPLPEATAVVAKRQTSGAHPFTESSSIRPTTSSPSFDHVSSVTSMSKSSFTGPASTSSFVKPSPTFGAADSQPNYSSALGSGAGNPGTFGTTPAYTPQSVDNSVPTSTSSSGSVDSSSLLASIFPSHSDPMAATASTVYKSPAAAVGPQIPLAVSAALATTFALCVVWI